MAVQAPYSEREWRQFHVFNLVFAAVVVGLWILAIIHPWDTGLSLEFWQMTSGVVVLKGIFERYATRWPSLRVVGMTSCLALNVGLFGWGALHGRNGAQWLSGLLSIVTTALLVEHLRDWQRGSRVSA